MSETRDRVTREERIPIEAEATVEFASGQSTHAKSMNMTSGGVLLRFDSPVSMAVGDQVTCEFVVEHDPDIPLPYWGLGKIVRIDGGGSDAAVKLQATTLVPSAPNSSVAPVPLPDRL